MSAWYFEQTLAALKKPPVGVKVNLATWNELKAAGLIEWKQTHTWGLFNLGFSMPYYKQTFLICDPDMTEPLLLPPRQTYGTSY
jgi:hypothetical protein